MFLRVLRGSVVRARPRTAAAAAAIFVPAALVAAVSNFLLDARIKVSRELRRRGPNLVLVNAGRVPLGELRARLRASEVATPLAKGLWRVEGTEIPLFGFDMEEGRKLREGWRVEGSWPKEGVLLGTRLAARLGLAVGGRLGGLLVEGIVETGAEEDAAAFMSLGLALRHGASVGAIELSLARTVEEVEAEAAAFEGEWPPVEARVQRQIAASEGAILGRLTLAFGLVGALVLAVSALAAATALAAALGERRHEFGVFRALGAGDARVVRLLAAEAGVLLAAGLLPGAAAGLGLSVWLGKSAFGQVVSVHPAAVGAAALACALVAAIGAVEPVRRALAIEPARVLKEE